MPHLRFRRAVACRAVRRCRRHRARRLAQPARRSRRLDESSSRSGRAIAACSAARSTRADGRGPLAAARSGTRARTRRRAAGYPRRVERRRVSARARGDLDPPPVALGARRRGRRSIRPPSRSSDRARRRRTRWRWRSGWPPTWPRGARRRQRAGARRRFGGASRRARSGRTTVAVLGSGADVVYPPRAPASRAEIAERGALVSELAPGTPPARRTSFRCAIASSAACRAPWWSSRRARRAGRSSPRGARSSRGATCWRCLATC